MIALATMPCADNPFLVAKALASQGLAVFPVRAKQPLTPNGVYSATSDLRELLRMDWRNANGVGLATGEVSGIDVLDVDLRDGDGGLVVDRKGSSVLPHGPAPGVSGFAALAQMPALPDTLTAQTPRNGRHFYFHHVAGGRSRKLCGDGSVEWFSTGKLVVVPPAPGRSWVNSAEIAEAPAWLRALVLAPRDHLHGNGQGVQRNPSGPLLSANASTSESTSNGQVPRKIYLLILKGMRNAPAQAQRRVQGLWANLAAKASLRNDGLNYTAWQFSGFIERGQLDREKAAKLLWLACERNGYLAKDGADVVKEVFNRVLGGGQ